MSSHLSPEVKSSEDTRIFEAIRKYALNKYGATVVAITTATGLVAGCAPSSENYTPQAAASEAPAQENSEPNTDTQTVSNENNEQATSDSSEFAADKSPEQLSESLNTSLEDWFNAGTDDLELHSQWILAKAKGEFTSDEEFLKPIVEANAKEFADKLLVDGWQNNPDLTNWVEHFKAKNLGALASWLRTVNTGDNREEPFQYTVESGDTTTISETDSEVTTSTPITEFVNIDKNRALELQPGWAEINGSASIVTATFTLAGSSYKISGLNIVNSK